MDFPRNLKMETVATCSTTDGNGSYHELAPSFFEEMTRCRRQKHCQRLVLLNNYRFDGFRFYNWLPVSTIGRLARTLVLSLSLSLDLSLSLSVCLHISVRRIPSLATVDRQSLFRSLCPSVSLTHTHVRSKQAHSPNF